MMGRGILTEAVLAEMRAAIRRCSIWWERRKAAYRVLRNKLLARPWQEARPGVAVKLLAEDGELYVFAQIAARVSKERAMCRRLRDLAACSHRLTASESVPSAISASR